MLGKRLSLVILVGALAGAVSSAEENAAIRLLQEENQLLRQRLDKLEAELGQLKKHLTTASLSQEKLDRLHQLADSKKKPVMAGLELELYGYVKLDGAYDDSRVNPGNFARWVENESILNDDSQFSLTANQTRLGLNITGPQVGAVTTSGKVEIDFYGGGASENKSNPMLRHAYAVFAWPEKRFAVLAGQTSDIISPLFMPTVNYSVGWWQGNVGYRRPQLRLTQSFAFSDSTELKLELGPTRTITDSTFVTGSVDSGADAAVPTIQARSSLRFPVGGSRSATIGVSGHWGQEDQHVTNTAGIITGHEHVDTWSVNLDFQLPITKWLLIQGEFFYGENLFAYLGGIGQKGDITTRGAWAAATFTPRASWQFNVGGGFDDPDDDDLTGKKDNDRTFNWVVFANANYTLTANLTLSLELMYLRTEYLAAKAGEAVREQLAVTYKF